LRRGLKLKKSTPAALTQSENLHRVPKRRKITLPGECFLQFFNAGMRHFEAFPAFDADEMVVVPVVIFMLIPGDPVAELHLIGEARFRQKLHGAVHGSIPDRTVLFFNQSMQFLDGQVPFGGKKNPQYHVSLGCMTKAPETYERIQYFAFFIHNNSPGIIIENCFQYSTDQNHCQAKKGTVLFFFDTDTDTRKKK
jgi:hypothetical protein